MKDKKAVFSPVRMRGGRSSWGVPGDGGGSLTVTMRYPADVKALIIACSGRCQKVRTAGWPLNS